MPTEPNQLEAILPLARAADIRHRGQANHLFCDGHVEFLNSRLMFVDDEDEVLRRWNVDNKPHR
jgi:prepilin-type processing-associated H-X9-DG protein